MNKKILHRPLNRWQINQKYGENTVCYNLSKEGEYIWCDGYNPPTGYKSIYGDAGHKGIDLQATMWTPVFAAQRGNVYFIDKNEKSGYDVRIESTEDGLTLRHIYEHLAKWNVEKGDWVETGQHIGWVGTTGYSTGPHLHFQVEDEYDNKLNPEMYLSDIKATEVLAINDSLKSVTQKLGIIGTIIKHLFSLSTPGDDIMGKSGIIN